MYATEYYVAALIPVSHPAKRTSISTQISFTWCNYSDVFGFTGTNPCGSNNGGCQYICLL